MPGLRVHVVGLGRNHDVAPPGDEIGQSPVFVSSARTGIARTADAVVRAFNELRATFPAARLDIVGEHPQLDEPGITCHGCWRWTIRINRRLVAELFQTSTCLVMPSWHEPTGTVHAEAAAAGLPSIGNRRRRRGDGDRRGWPDHRSKLARRPHRRNAEAGEARPPRSGSARSLERSVASLHLASGG